MLCFCERCLRMTFKAISANIQNNMANSNTCVTIFISQSIIWKLIYSSSTKTTNTIMSPLCCLRLSAQSFKRDLALKHRYMLCSNL